jgi:hypothetical protein
MSTMITELYKALVEAGATEDTAQQAAKAVADYDQKIANVDRQLLEMRHEISGRFTLLQWMIGFSLALNTAILLKLMTT